MASEDRSWGTPRIHSEVLKLGIVVSERTVARYMPKRRAGPDALERWMTFLRNHREGIAAMDFFVVPTATFRVLYVLFVILSFAKTRSALQIKQLPHLSILRPGGARRSRATC